MRRDQGGEPESDGGPPPESALAPGVDVPGNCQRADQPDHHFRLVDGERHRLDVDRVDGEEEGRCHRSPEGKQLEGEDQDGDGGGGIDGQLHHLEGEGDAAAQRPLEGDQERGERPIQVTLVGRRPVGLGEDLLRLIEVLSPRVLDDQRHIVLCKEIEQRRAAAAGGGAGDQ